MPTVPRVTGPSVELRALPNAMQSAAGATPEAFGAGAARALGQAAQAVGQWAERKQEQEDADAVMLADADLKGAWIEQERELLNRRGQAAWGAVDDTKRWFDETARRAGGNLKSATAQRSFRRAAEALKLRALDFAGRHEDDQRRESVVASAQTRITADINLAASDPTPASVATSKRSIAGSVAAVGSLNGWDAHRVAVETLNHVGNLHKQVLQGMVEQNPIAAETYFAANKAEIPGALQAELGHLVRVGATMHKAQAFADDALARGLPEADAMKAIREKLSGDQEDTFATVLKTRYAEVHAQRERVQNDAAEHAWAIVSNGGSWNNVPARLQATLDPRTSIAIKSHLKERANAAGVDRTQTDWALYAQLRDEAADDPQGFAKKNLVQFFHKLAPPQRETLVDIKGAIAANARKPGKSPKDAIMLTQQLNAQMLDHGIRSDKTRGKFLAFVQAEVDDATQAKDGKALTFDERKAIIDRALLRGPDPDAWFGSKRVFQLTREQRARFKPEVQVPAADRQQIIEALRTYGRPVTEEEIAFEYTKGR